MLTSQPEAFSRQKNLNGHPVLKAKNRNDHLLTSVLMDNLLQELHKKQKLKFQKQTNKGHCNS